MKLEKGRVAAVQGEVGHRRKRIWGAGERCFTVSLLLFVR
jgi:hypothetical protein